MPRYFFHVHDGSRLPNYSGTELPDLQAAKHMAVRMSGKLLSEQPERFWNGEEWSLDCCDATDLILFTLHFLAAMSPATGSTRASSG